MGAQRASQPFGHTTANLASGGVCSTARLLRRDRVVKTVHRQLPVRIAQLSLSGYPMTQLPLVWSN